MPIYNIRRKEKRKTSLCTRCWCMVVVLFQSRFNIKSALLCSASKASMCRCNFSSQFYVHIPCVVHVHTSYGRVHVHSLYFLYVLWTSFQIQPGVVSALGRCCSEAVGTKGMKQPIDAVALRFFSVKGVEK